MTLLRRPCLACGVVTTGTRCEPCQADHQRATWRAEDARRGSATSRGYDARWKALSARARKTQPFCEVCGTDRNLTTDHSPDAWAKRARGERLTLADVAVLCLTHNIEAGAARGANVTRRDRAQDPGGETVEGRGVATRGGRPGADYSLAGGDPQ